MGSAPLPPHERSWRHPSELAPTSVNLDERPRPGRSIVFATGVLAVALVAAIIISIDPTPPPPDAVSATTIAVIAATAQEREPSPAPEPEPAPVLLRQRGVTPDRSVTLTGAPAAVSAKHVADPADLDLAPHSPDDHHTVVLLTRTHTFLVDWGDLTRIDAPDGAVVVTSDGHLLATFVSGELRILVD